ncbi:acetyl esterase/lipase [Ancylobacter aquaticus]|uniref:Acetyl esterase/lipase n=1 Tax=Ancylobacter aquaticus TaxID=100 RepID=A0A4R1I147_ANCAQ|nr:alpha/beta hydrolase [Ancylobacter aquaticus]TCK23642.1 acetyl esterase/lipase [Ancylobacter aquaticus]
MRAALLLVAALLSTGAARAAEGPAAVLNALSRLEPVRVTENIAYADGPRHRLDVYAPTFGATQGLQVVVFFYGGSWDSGDRAMYRFVGAALAARGMVVVIPDYRLYPEVRFPAFLEDGARAVQWARANAAAYGGDPSRLILMGHSAGAQIAAMLAFDRQWLGAVRLDPRRDVAGLVGLAGPYDFLPLESATLKKIFGPPAGRERSQPINFVTGEAPPAFLATGARDTTVDPGNSKRLAARIRAKGGEATLKVYDRPDHRLILGALSPPLRLVAPVLDDVTGFVRQLSQREAGR